MAGGWGEGSAKVVAGSLVVFVVVDQFGGWHVEDRKFYLEPLRKSGVGPEAVLGESALLGHLSLAFDGGFQWWN